jgi:2-methylcitrate dehydratase PrpD
LGSRFREVPRAPLPSHRLTGTFAAAAAAGKLYGLSEDELVRAFGICGSQAAGIIEYLADGSWTKRLHPGGTPTPA